MEINEITRLYAGVSTTFTNSTNRDHLKDAMHTSSCKKIPDILWDGLQRRRMFIHL